MKKLIMVLIAAFGFAASANAQDLSDPRNMLDPGTSAEVSAWQEECRRTDNVEPGTCLVTVGYQSDYFPVLFIQDGEILERVDSPEAGASGFEAVQGVKYENLPGGGMKYVLEIRNPRGGTFIVTKIGA